MTIDTVAPPLLDVQNLSVSFTQKGNIVPIINDLSFSLYPGQTLGIAGESGCGKTMTALSILRLIRTPPLKEMSGVIRYDGDDLLTLTKQELHRIRGGEIGLIFQEPMTAMNPVFTIGDQIVEMILTHKKMKKRKAWERGIHLLQEVGIPGPEIRMKSYPHELSGGMRQRAMIATALSCSPRILIADEPTTALDVTIQAQILELFKTMKNKRDMAIIFITHDLGVIAEIADHVLILRNGRLVEYNGVEDIFHRPQRPYTRKLLNLIPKRTANAGT